MRLEDLVDVRRRPVTIPDALGIDHQGRSVFATIEAARAVDARVGETELLRSHFHIIAQFLAALLHAAALGMARRPRVRAAEDMMTEEKRRIGHDSSRYGGRVCGRKDGTDSIGAAAAGRSIVEKPSPRLLRRPPPAAVCPRKCATLSPTRPALTCFSTRTTR